MPEEAPIDLNAPLDDRLSAALDEATAQPARPVWKLALTLVAQAAITMIMTTAFVFVLSLISGIALSVGEAVAAAWLLVVLMKARV